MMPLNVIGELAKIISISFRLFGNIMGGSIIILVVSYLCYSIILPPFLNAFFGLFVGTIQAFVFTMLTVVYISVQVK
jgi:F-type H+-transporting ATPase subunit a